ncbi:MAG TPA: AraC family transcriptional regulator [Candidatus Paenibacillus intestinavium]|nr:AraC family transcriptional regulator [Candidatus Paenibacillus intestinavium]
MKNNWYKKTLLSYIPILYVTIAIIVFIAIFVVAEISMKEAEQTKQYTTQYLVSSLETQLATLERRMIEKLLVGDGLYDFYNYTDNKNAGESGLINFEANKTMRFLLAEFPIIHSVYLYRAYDQKVLSLDSYESVNDFADQPFIFHELQKSDKTRAWSIPRNFSDGIGLEPSHDHVISFTQRTQLPMGDQGIIVINVSVNKLLSIVDHIVDPNHTYMMIFSRDNELIYATNELDDSKRITTTIASKYMQWEFQSGLQTTFSLYALRTISRSWIAFGFAVILISLIYTIHITKRNYRPIEKIVSQIQSFQQHVITHKSSTDEFSFIQKALERLNDENMQYEAKVQESMQQSKTQAFIKLLESNNEGNYKRWGLTLDRLVIPNEFTKAVVVIVEIDHYTNFEKKYNNSYDQGLIKFAISNVLHEYLFNIGNVWSEWTRLNRMGFIQMMDSEEQYEEWKLALDKFRVWVAVNMGLTVTIGVGKVIHNWEDMHHSYTDAVETLKYKFSYGSNRILPYEQVVPVRSNNIHLYYQEINSLVQDFRRNQKDWPQRLEQFFANWQAELFTNDENMNLMQYFKRLLVQLQAKLPSELKKTWNEVLETKWDVMVYKESVQEVALSIVTLLQDLYNQFTEHMNAKDSKQTIHQIRKYVDENFVSPELSLNLISEQFNLNSKYVSQLFKEQLGINFADYVMERRIELAKTLLLSTDNSINEVSSQIGYEIPLSFGRAFKKHVGVSPTDYRKNKVEEERRIEVQYNREEDDQ